MATKRRVKSLSKVSIFMIFVVIAGVVMVPFALRPDVVADVPTVQKKELPGREKSLAAAISNIPSASAFATVSSRFDSARESAEVVSVKTILVTGRTVDAGNAPIANANIQLLSGKSRKPIVNTKTDSQGSVHFTFDAEAERPLHLNIQHPNYASREFWIGSQGPKHALGNIEMAAACSIRGTLVDAKENPIKGASINITHSANGGQVYNVVTGSNGGFDVSGLPSGFATFRIADVHYVLAEKNLRCLTSPPSTSNITLKALSRDPSELYNGIVMNEEGAPVPNAPIVYWYDGDRYISSVDLTADKDGRFSFPRNPRICNFEAWDPAGKLAPARIFNAQPGKEILQFTLKSAKKVAVKAVGPGGAPVNHYNLTIRDARRPEFQDNLSRRPWTFARKVLSPYDQTITSADGVGSVAAPGDGPFVITIEAPEFEFKQLECPRPNDTNPIEVPLTPKAAVRGKVVSAGAPVAGANVELLLGNGKQFKSFVEGFPSAAFAKPIYKTKSAANGEFILYIDDSERFLISAAADGYAPEFFGPSTKSELENGGPVILTLGKGGSVRGKVTMASGESPDGVIVAIHDGLSVPRTVRCDEAGQFRFDDCRPGKWTASRVFKDIDPNRIINGPGDARFGENGSTGGVEFTITTGKESNITLDLSANPLLKVNINLGGCQIIDGTLDANGPSAFSIYPFQNIKIGSRNNWTIVTREAGAYKLEANLLTSKFQSIAISRAVEVSRDGGADWNYNVQCTTVSGKVVQSDPYGVVTVESESPAGKFSTRAATNRDGNFEVPCVPEGKIEISWARTRGPKLLTKVVDATAGVPVNIVLE